MGSAEARSAAAPGVPPGPAGPSPRWRPLPPRLQLRRRAAPSLQAAAGHRFRQQRQHPVGARRRRHPQAGRPRSATAPGAPPAAGGCPASTSTVSNRPSASSRPRSLRGRLSRSGWPQVPSGSGSSIQAMGCGRTRQGSRQRLQQRVDLPAHLPRLPLGIGVGHDAATGMHPQPPPLCSIGCGSGCWRRSRHRRRDGTGSRSRAPGAPAPAG